MSSEPKKEPDNTERSEREKGFARRGLLQWSVPAILAVSLPAQVSAGSGHGDHGDHTDMAHDDTFQDTHQDHEDMGHGDSHTDNPHIDFADGSRPEIS